MNPYDREKLLRFAQQGKLVVLVPVVVGVNVTEDDFRTEGGEAFQNVDDQTITLVAGPDRRYVFASASLLGEK